MKLRIAVLGMMVWVWAAVSAEAMDWKALHERADTLSQEQAEGELAGDPASPEKLYSLGLVYLNLRQDRRAEEIFQLMLQADPGSFPASWGRAEVLRRRHELAESEKILDQLIGGHPDFAPPYVSLAFLHFVRQDFNRAAGLCLAVIRMGRDKVDLTNYVRAITLYSGSKGMIADRGGPVSKLVNGPAVLMNLKKAQKLQPDSLSVLFGLGGYYLLAPAFAGGDLNLAIKYLEKAREADPRFADVYVRLAQAYKMKKDRAKYQAYLQKALELDPGNEFAWDVKSGKCRFICPGEKD